MKLIFNNLSLRRQFLLFLMPVIFIFVVVISYLNYNRSIDSLLEREKDKKENIEEGVKLFIDNYDLSLLLFEKELEDRIKILVNDIFERQITNLYSCNLDSLQEVIGMNEKTEFLYIFNNKGIVINTTKKSDLGFDFFEMGETYKAFFEKVAKSKKLEIERIGIEASTNSPTKYAYQAIDENYILEIGIQYETVNKIIDDFNAKIETLSNKYSNILSIDLFGATEAFPSRNKSSIMEDNIKPLAKICYESQRDTIIEKHVNGEIITTDLIYLPIRNSMYFNGYILQIITDNSLENTIFKSELKRFIYSLLFTLLIAVLIFFLITKKMTHPLEQLAVNIRQIREENKIESVDIRGSSETAYLQNEFNNMTAEIREHYISLESKIEERTKDIGEKNKDLKKMSDERGLLMKEIHHRVKNNLQIIASFLNLQADKLKSKEAITAFENSKNRVLAMAVLHEKLYRSSNFITIKGTDYLNDLVAVLKDIISDSITITVKASDVDLNSTESLSIGVIINEAFINAIKYAFDKGDDGQIEISMCQNETHITLEIFNNGKKIPDDFVEKQQNKSTLGITIIEAFTEKLDGEFTFSNVEKGVVLKIVFPKTDTL